MKKLSFFLFAAFFVPIFTWAQNTPVCGLNNDETPLLPSQSVGKVTVSGSTVTWTSGSHFVPGWTGTIYLYPSSGNGTSYAISSVASATSLTLSSSPTSGSYDYTYNMNWDSFSAPALGASYIDPLSGCQITRVSQLGSSSLGVIYDSEEEPFSQDDQMMWLIDYVTGDEMIVSTPANTAYTPGTPVLTTSQMPPKNSNTLIWSFTASNQFYYTSGTSIMLGTINGLPNCIASRSCSVSTSTVASFSGSGGSTGSGYTSIIFPDKYDGFPGAVAFLGRNSSGTMDLDVYNLNTGENTVWYTTSCTASNPLGSQPGCIHGILQLPDGTAIIGYGGADGSLSGGVWFHGTPGNSTVTKTQIMNQSLHNSVGEDINGNEVLLIDRVDSTLGGEDPCPAGQWSGSTAGGGLSMISLTDPGNLSHTAACVLNKDWAQPELSYRGGPSQPWFTTSIWDNSRTGASAEYYSTNSKYVSPSCTQTNSTVGGTCWFPYQDEIIMTKINTDMASPSTAALATVYRLGLARSRSLQNFWSIPNASMSRDGNYIAFSSNMAYPTGGCSSSYNSSGGCAEAYVISAAGGGGLLGSVSGSPAPPPTNNPAPPTGLTATVH